MAASNAYDRGRIERQLTAGDARDITPCFSADGGSVLYASSGLGRADDGAVMACQPFRILRVDLASGAVEELAGDPAWDYLLPRPGPDGSVLAVRRPHRPIGQGGLAQELRGCLLFPFNLVGAVLGFAQAFIRMFNRSPLATAGAPRWESRRKVMQVLEETIDCARLRAGDEAIVPEGWSLVEIGSGDGRVRAGRVLDHRWFFRLCSGFDHSEAAPA